MRIVFASARSSPGVTTSMLALASAWPGEVLLVEAAEDGGVLGPRFGLASEPGLTTLVAASRHAADAKLILDHTQALPGTDGRLVALVGPSSPDATAPMLRLAADRLATMLDGLDRTVFIDAGRLTSSPAAAGLLSGANRVLMVARPRVEEVRALAHRLVTVRDLAPQVEVLLVGAAPYGADEVEGALGVPVVGVLPVDGHAADSLAGIRPDRRLRRSLLLRSAASLGDDLRTAPARVPRPSFDSVSSQARTTAKFSSRAGGSL